MRYLLKQLSGYKKESILAPLFKLLEAGFDLLVPLVMADIINVGIAGGDRGYILGRCAILVGLAVVGLACSTTAQYFAAKAAVGCAAGMRRELYAHIQTLGFAELDALGGSTLVTRMTSDAAQVQNGLNLALRLLLRSPFIVLGSVAMAFVIDVRSALIFVAVTPVLAAVVLLVMRRTAPMYRGIQARMDTVVGLTRENLSGVRVVRAFGREAAEEQRFAAANGALARAQRIAGRIAALMNPLSYVAVNLGIVALLATGAVRVAGPGSLPAGDLIALINYMGQILVELVKLANTVIQTGKAAACAGRIASVLETKPAMAFPEQEDMPDIRPGAPAVCFENVSFRYEGAGGESLSDISFAAMPGQTIGIIGGTGSGKTSLVNLIPRFYDATGGSVSLFGIPVSQWPREPLRACVSVVMQRAQLFAGTIRSNLLWGDAEADDDALWAALKTAQAADFVAAKPLGLDEPVEQGGRNLSGGQRQRLTIARALVARPRVLILDDSASALDFATDAALRRAIRALPEDITVFIVSQRAASLRHADSILVLDEGRLVASGTHEELLRECDVYREIYLSQFKKGGEA